MIVTAPGGGHIPVNGFGDPKIKGGVLNRGEEPCGNEAFIYRHIVRGVEQYLMGEDVPGPLPRQVEIGVVGKVHRTRGVYFGLIIGDDLVGFGKAVTDRRLEAAGVAFIPFGTFQVEPDEYPVFFLVRFSVPEEFVKTPPAAVQGMGTVVFVEAVFPPSQKKLCPADTVSKPAYGGPNVGLVPGIAVQGRVP
jgi:hypothetical protein